MVVSVKHAKTNTITDWTQTDLDNIIAGQPAPLPPSGTLISEITLPSDWNADHTIDTTGAADGDVLTVVAGQAEWATPASGGGDVVGPASSTDNAIARYDGTTGKLIQNSGVIIDDSNNITGVGTLDGGSQTISGTETITSTSASALTVGRNGSTNPALQIDCATASSATGIRIKSAAAGGGVEIRPISSAASENLVLGSLVSGNIVFQTNTVTRATFTTSTVTWATGARSGTTAASWLYTGPTGSTLTAATDAPIVHWNFSNTQTHNSGSAIPLQRDFRIDGATHAFTAASTMTAGGTLVVDGAPVAGTNATITDSAAIHVTGKAVGSGVTNSYGLNITANTGATNNYCVRYAGTAGEIYRVRTDGQIAFLATNTAGGTTGDQTINRPSGTVNFAAAATSLTVTNSLCTTSSIVFAVVRTNDTTATIKNVVPGSGSFVINLNAAATAETSVGFFIIN